MILHATTGHELAVAARPFHGAPHAHEVVGTLDGALALLLRLHRTSTGTRRERAWWAATQLLAILSDVDEDASERVAESRRTLDLSQPPSAR